MNKRWLKISPHILLVMMSLLTILFFLDIKFVVIGANILVWDVLVGGIWVFVRLCKWAGRENTGKRTLAATAIVLAGLFAAPVLLFGLAMCGGIPQYTQGTEPQTHRTFVVESYENMMSKGTAKVYERFGPLLFPCDVPEYKGQLTFEESDAEYAKVYISDEKQAIVVSLFTYGPRFSIPLKLPEGTEKTPERVLLEQPKDDDHDAFLVKTGGALGTLLVTAERERTPTVDCDFTVHFAVWDPASMDEPLQTLTDDTNIFGDWNVIDANFDGYMDFTFTYLRGNASNYDHLWLWDENHGQFVRRSDYDEISNPVLDAETETIYGFNRSSGGGTGEHTFYQWSEGQLLCVRRIEIYPLDLSDTVRMSVQDRIAGELVEIYHEDFTPESSGWLEAETIWHDLDYHGDPGGFYDVFLHQNNIQAYLPVISNSDIEDVAFSLIFLDDDTIPELVIFDRYCNEYSVYTIRNDSVECLIDSLITVEMSYFERKSIVSTFIRWNGGGDEGGYASDYYLLDQYSEALTDKSIPSFGFYYVAVYDENGEWTGDGITEYYEMDEKIDEAAYKQIIIDSNIAQESEISCFPEGRLHFTKGEMVAYLTEMVQ